MPEKVVTWSDADFASCKDTTRSISGGLVMLGQETIALSFGESEVYWIAKIATTGLLGFAGRLGGRCEGGGHCRFKSGSIVSRRGAGRVRHVEIQELLVQDRVAKGEFSVVKVKGDENAADGLTKHVYRLAED